jgi:hypothetical protein
MVLAGTSGSAGPSTERRANDPSDAPSDEGSIEEECNGAASGRARCCQGAARVNAPTGALTAGERADLTGSWSRLVERANAQAHDLDLRRMRVPW